MLLGRERECRQIDQLIDDARARRSSSIVIRGDPGIGKSALLRYAEGQAGEMRVLRATGVDSESELPFGALHELLLPTLGLLDTLPGVQREALSAALAVGPPAFAERLAVHAAAFALLAEAAELSSLLCVIDDAHWLDSASAEAILFTCRRLHAEGILVIMAAREGERIPFEAVGVPDLMLGGLEPGAARELLQRGGIELAPHVAEQLIRMTMGNALALIELPSALSREQREGREVIAEPLPVGEDVQHAFLGRVRALSDRTQGALIVVAASDSSSVNTIAKALESLDLGPEDLDDAEAAGLVTVTQGRVEFRHPLVRSAIYRAAAPAMRRSAHRVLAAALTGRHTESRAWHLAAAAAAPDEGAAAALEEVAREANSRGAPAVAATTFARAAALSPNEEDRARRLVASGSSSWLAGRSEQALTQLAAALEATSDPRLRADAQLLRGRALTWTSDVMEAYRLLVTEADIVEPVDRTRAALMLSEAVFNCAMAGKVTQSIETARRAEELARNGPAELLASSVLAMVLALHGEPAARGYVSGFQRAIEGVDSPAAYQLSGIIAQVLIMVEEYEPARKMLDLIVAARGRGIVHPHALAVRADLDFRVGRWSACHADVSESVDLARETGQGSALAFGLLTLARVEATTGRERDCREHVAAATDLLAPLGIDSIRTFAGSVLGILELGLGRPFEAVTQLEPVARIMEEHGVGDPAVLQWAPDLVEAYFRAGRRSDAQVALTKLETQAHSTGRTWAHATAARCRGLLASEAAFDDEFAAAISWHAKTPTPFERARTELCHGERLRRSGRRVEARVVLHSALATFESLNAEPWAERARAELRATGERVRKREESTVAKLTTQELQVARLVSEGGTNREVAARLMLSPRTIEFHLRNVYAKIGVRSRTELAAKFAHQDPEVAVDTQG